MGNLYASTAHTLTCSASSDETSNAAEIEHRAPNTTIIDEKQRESTIISSSTSTTSADLEPGTPSRGHGREHENVPRADGGRHAWLFLAGCFVFEALVWGFPFSFGVFQSYYSTHPPFSHSPNSIAIIGTCSTGIMYLVAPISLHVLEAWPFVRRLSSIIGLIVIVSALIGSSFSTAVWHLILTQGVLYAIGGSLLYAPTMFYLDEWFIERKGLAFGVMWSGVGTSGLIFPYLLSALLTRHGFRTTLRIWALILAAFSVPLIYFVKSRFPTPPSLPRNRRRNISYAFLKSRTFWFLQAANIAESLGFFLPSIYLPSYTSSVSSISYSSTITPEVEGNILVSLLNSFSVLGAISLGHLCDHYHVNTSILLSTFGSTLSTLLLWGLGGSHFASLIVFAMCYGVFAGGWSAIWSGMMREVQRGSPEAGMGTLMGLFSAGRGVGAILSGPLSEALLSGWTWMERDIGAFGSRYGGLVIFTGISALCGVLCLGVKRKGI